MALLASIVERNRQTGLPVVLYSEDVTEVMIKYTYTSNYESDGLQLAKPNAFKT